ncbi:phage tail assembly protein [Pseudomonas sp. GD03860]|uniref:phage tail assembly protein n=1 Tax=Pseudomonas TaxID=286 RepID=UPI00236453D5|nr:MULTISPECIES: phage tail assembly protein [Pseudomonas]MDD2059068.1 phage tail assembly protein [Pseudomonas putida]MDH0640790.1 phage tail assembly protein [Pseudomonas sp. GD03860]
MDNIPPNVEVEAKQIDLDENTVQLDTPVKRGNTVIEHVTLRKPNAGEMRGLHLAELLNWDVGSLIKLLPRICQLNAQEVAQLDPADLVALGGKVTGFLLQKQTKTDASLVA